MFASAMSRWTLLHFWVAIVFFVAAQTGMITGAAYPGAPLSAPITLATLHLLTIGWLTVLMLGALYQFLPVITAQTTFAGHSALVSLLAIVIGLGGMEAGFLALGGVLPSHATACLPIGGTLTLVGFIVAGGALGRILWRTRPLPFSAQFVAAGLFFLVATAVLGILMAIMFADPDLMPWPQSPSKELGLHLVSGLIGWFALTAMGVSYRLLSMFTLAPENRGAVGTFVLALSAGGLAIAWLLGVLDAIGFEIPGEQPALAAAAAGIALYLFDMLRLYRSRRRRKLELNTLAAVPALIALGICLVGGTYAAVAGELDRFLGPLAYLFVFGWLSGLALGQLYKIMPFLTWLERFASLLGKQTVPRVQDLVDESRDRPWFALYFAAVAFGTVSGAFGWTMLWRGAVAAHLLATLMIVRALWLVRRRAPSGANASSSAQGPSANPSSSFAANLTIMER